MLNVFIDGDLVQVISEDTNMITYEASLYNVNASAQHPMGKVSQDKTFYDQVRSDFLKQSARYLRDSFYRSKASRFGAA